MTNLESALEFEKDYGLTFAKTLSKCDTNKIKNQRMISFLLGVNYFCARSKITLNGLDNLPDGQFAIAMNHSSSFYSFWPLQYAIYRKKKLLSTVWTKPRDPLTNWFFRQMGLITIPSSTTIKQKAFAHKYGRELTREELQQIKAGEVSGDLEKFTHEDIPQLTDYQNQLLKEMDAKTYALLQKKGSYLLAFPEGTRSLMFGAKNNGRDGLARWAYSNKILVVPVGSNKAEKIYPWNKVPLSPPSLLEEEVSYNIGEPIMLDLGVEREAVALGKPLDENLQEKVSAGTKLIMKAINDLLEPPYRNPNF